MPSNQVIGTNVGSIYYDVTLDTSKVIDGTRVVDREVGRAAGSFNVLTTAVKLLAVALAALKVAQLADDIRLMGVRVQVAAGSVEAGNAAMTELIAISRRTQTSIAGNVEVFTRLNQSLVQMGATQFDTLRLTELLGKAIKVSGASAVEAKNAMIQFGQALGSGKLQGDELRSLMETAPYLMKQLADGLGKPIGELKKLGEQGKLTSDVVVNALTKAKAKIEADFAQFPQTLSGALTLVEDAALRANEKLDTLTGNSVALTGAAQGLSQVLDELAKQFGAANAEAGKLGRNEAIKRWADQTKVVLSYVVDAADLVWQTLSVLGRNVAFVFTGIGNEIGGIGAQVKAVLNGDFAGAAAIGQAMRADAEQRRKELDEADRKTLSRAKLAGQQMREAWEQGAGGGRGSINPPMAGDVKTKLKPPKDDDAARKAEAKKLAAQSYYEALVIGNKTALEKVDAEERKALLDNKKHMAENHENAAIYEKARVEIVKKFARERALLEEKNTREIAELNIAMTTDEMARIEAVKAEEFRRAEAEQRLGLKTAAEAERAKSLAIFTAGQAYIEVAERNARASAEIKIQIAKDEEAAITLEREEAIRRAFADYERDKTTFIEYQAEITKALKTETEKRKALQDQRADFVIGTLQMQAGSGGAAAQEDLIRAQAAKQMSDAAEQARRLDLENSQAYADRKVAIETDMNRRIAELRANANMAALQSTSDAFGAIVNVLRQSAGEQSGIYKVMFAAQKAFAIASSIVAIQKGIAEASSLPWPANLAAMASVVASTASIISTIQGTNYGGGRQYGGPASAGTLYRVNEGGRPEMFTASNGAQYMMPTKDGRVTSAGGAGAGGDTFVFHNTINVGAGASRAEVAQAVAAGNQQVKADILRSRSRGGAFA